MPLNFAFRIHLMKLLAVLLRLIVMKNNDVII